VAAAAICRSVGEALRNVARHAGVPRATVLVGYDGGRVVVEVVDDGRGFDPGAVPAHRHGIALSLVDRMAAVGGRAAVTARPGQGTRVRMEWPDG
jgi:signal transduction histidine kinase